MSESAERKYYSSKKNTLDIPGLRHEGPKNKVKPKVFVNSDTRNSDKYYKDMPTVLIEQRNPASVTSIVINKTNVAEIVTEAISALSKGGFDRVVFVCLDNTFKDAMTRLELAVGRFVLTAEQLARIQFVESKAAAEEPKQVEPELKVVEPKITTVEPKVETVEPKVETVEPKVTTVEPTGIDATANKPVSFEND